MTKNNKHRILVVDDEPNILTSISFLLQKEGHEVITATTGAEAIEKYMASHPRIVFMDVMMPEMDGYAAAKSIRAIAEGQDLNIIFLTAKGTSADRREGFLSGAEEYIVKPFDNQQIIDVIEEIA